MLILWEKAARLKYYIISIMLFFLVLLLPGVTRAQSFTKIEFCHMGGPPLYIAIYETYQGILSGYEGSGWYMIEAGDDCMRDIASAREVKAYAFATKDDLDRIVELNFEFNIRRQTFSRSTENICVPLTKALSSFTTTSQNQAIVSAPCRPGDFPVRTSLNIRGGDADQTFQFSITVPVGHAPNADYLARWEQQFGPSDSTTNAATTNSPDTTSDAFKRAIIDMMLRPKPQQPPPEPFVDYQKQAEEMNAQLSDTCSALATGSHIIGDLADPAHCNEWRIWRDLRNKQDQYRDAIRAYTKRCNPFVKGPVYILKRWLGGLQKSIFGRSSFEDGCLAERAAANVVAAQASQAMVDAAAEALVKAAP